MPIEYGNIPKPKDGASSSEWLEYKQKLLKHLREVQIPAARKAQAACSIGWNVEQHIAQMEELVQQLEAELSGS